MTDNSPPDLLTTAQIAAKLGVSKQRVHAKAAELRRTGKRIGFQLSSGTWLYRPEDVERLRGGNPGRPRKHRDKREEPLIVTD